MTKSRSILILTGFSAGDLRKYGMTISWPTILWEISVTLERKKKHSIKLRLFSIVHNEAFCLRGGFLPSTYLSTTSLRGFSAAFHWQWNEINETTEQNKNVLRDHPSLQEANQLAIFKCSPEVGWTSNSTSGPGLEPGISDLKTSTLITGRHKLPPQHSYQ